MMLPNIASLNAASFAATVLDLATRQPVSRAPCGSNDKFLRAAFDIAEGRAPAGSSPISTRNAPSGDRHSCWMMDRDSRTSSMRTCIRVFHVRLPW